MTSIEQNGTAPTREASRLGASSLLSRTPHFPLVRIAPKRLKQNDVIKCICRKRFFPFFVVLLQTGSAWLFGYRNGHVGRHSAFHIHSNELLISDCDHVSYDVFHWDMEHMYISIFYLFYSSAALARGSDIGLNYAYGGRKHIYESLYDQSYASATRLPPLNRITVLSTAFYTYSANDLSTRLDFSLFSFAIVFPVRMIPSASDPQLSTRYLSRSRWDSS